MFFRRGVADNDPWLGPKLWLFSIGAGLALLGMALQNDWLIGAAAVVLLAGFALRFLKRPDGGPEDGGAENGGGQGGKGRGDGP